LTFDARITTLIPERVFIRASKINLPDCFRQE
jgi:hypothetical protein